MEPKIKVVNHGPPLKLDCVLCGSEVTRMFVVHNPVCFECKKRRVKERAELRRIANKN